MNIKQVIEINKIKQWQIAEIIGISEFTLSRWLRRPEKIPEEQRDKINEAISKLLKEGA